MFNHPFSYKGRIHRLEYVLSCVMCLPYLFVSLMIVVLLGDFGAPKGLHNAIPFALPLFWFLSAQGAKRCHDLNHSGWWQLIPLYCFWMLFAKGKMEKNIYGSHEKGINYLEIDESDPIFGKKREI